MNENPAWRTSGTYPTYERARAVYEPAFRTAFEYLYSNGLAGGAIAEFGVYRGFTAVLIAELITEFQALSTWYPMEITPKLFLFDSFAGFPKCDNPVDMGCYEIRDRNEWREGMECSPEETLGELEAYLQTCLPADSFEICPGFFAAVLESKPIAAKLWLLHLDCDLYSSTRTVLDYVLQQDLLQDGTIIMADDYNCNRANPQQGQRRALQEAFDHGGSAYSISTFFSYGWHGRAFFVHAGASRTLT